MRYSSEFLMCTWFLECQESDYNYIKKNRHHYRNAFTFFRHKARTDDWLVDSTNFYASTAYNHLTKLSHQQKF